MRALWWVTSHVPQYRWPHSLKCSTGEQCEFKVRLAVSATLGDLNDAGRFRWFHDIVPLYNANYNSNGADVCSCNLTRQSTTFGTPLCSWNYTCDYNPTGSHSTYGKLIAQTALLQQIQVVEQQTVSALCMNADPSTTKSQSWCWRPTHRTATHSHSKRLFGRGSSKKFLSPALAIGNVQVVKNETKPQATTMYCV